MARESGNRSPLKKEDLINILETVKDMGNNNKDISTEDFVKAIETHLLRAMSK